jgi:hypothetical protein
VGTKRWIPLLLVAVLPLAACGPERTDDVPEAEEMTPELDFDPAPQPPIDAEPPADMVAARDIEVTNPMPHPMIVTAMVDGQTVQVGTVPANATETFTIEARAGATVELEARDEPDTHRVQGSVTVGDAAARWTIAQ